MEHADDCKLLVGELIDINVRQRELVRKIGLYVARDGGNEQLMSALKNYLEHIDAEADAVRAVYVAVENLFAQDVLNRVNRK